MICVVSDRAFCVFAAKKQRPQTCLVLPTLDKSSKYHVDQSNSTTCHMGWSFYTYPSADSFILSSLLVFLAPQWCHI